MSRTISVIIYTIIIVLYQNSPAFTKLSFLSNLMLNNIRCALALTVAL